MRISCLRRIILSVASAAIVAVAFAPASSGTAPVNGKWRTYAYISVARTGSAVLINGLVKQDYSTGLIPSSGRTIYLQRNLHGSWQNMVSRVTNSIGRFSVSYIPSGTFQYRYLVTENSNAWGATSAVAAPPTPSVNQQIAAYAMTFPGRYPYAYGGTSPSTGFDCSGLTYYIYRQFGHTIATTAAAQDSQFRHISRSSAQPGDLVFFFDGSGYVFHVGIYEGSNMMVAAATPQDGIRYQSIWSSDVSFGTITH